METTARKIQFKFNHTLNKIGGFDLGDGEYFVDDLNLNELQLEYNPDFFVQCVESVIGGKEVFITYFIPSPKMYDTAINENYSGDWLDMFTNVRETIVTKDEVIDYILNNQKISIYEIKLEDIVVIDNMMWYYLGVGCSINETKYEAKSHPKYIEVLNLIEEQKNK